MTKAEVQEIIDEADENGDGKLDYKEVSNILSELCSCWNKEENFQSNGAELCNMRGTQRIWYVIWEELCNVGGDM